MSGDKPHPDKLHEREVERSNVTLNTFFGASRQKSWMYRGGAPVRPTPRSSQAVTALSQGSSSLRSVALMQTVEQQLISYNSIPSPTSNHKTRAPSLGKKTSSSANLARSEGLLQNKKKVTEDKPTATTNLVDQPNSRVDISQSLSDLNSDSSQPHSSRVVKPTTLEPASKSSTDLTIELERDLPGELDTEPTITLRKEQVTVPPEEPNIELPIVSDIEPLKEVRNLSKVKLPAGLKLEKETQLHVEPVAELRIKPTEELSINLCENSSELDLGSERIPQDSPSISLASYEFIRKSQSQINTENRGSLDSSGHLNTDQTLATNAGPHPESSMFTQPVNYDSHTCSNSVPQKRISPIISSKSNSQALEAHKDGSAHEITVTEASPMASPSQSIRFTLKSKLTMIEAQLKSVGGLESLNTGLERPRFQLLIEACRVEDLFYVILHQTYILWDFRREEVLGIPGASNIGSLQTGFRIVAKIIHENNQLAPNHKRWFAEFPYSLTKLLKTSDSCRKTCTDVLKCVLKLSCNWYPLMHECKTRLAPLLAEELVCKLGVLSPIFQRILFTSSRRSLGIRDEETIQAMDQIFKLNQSECRNLMAQDGETSQIPPQERQEQNDKILQNYNTLIIQCQRKNSSSTSNPKTSSPKSINNQTTTVLTPSTRAPVTLEAPRSQGNPQASQLSSSLVSNVLDPKIQQQQHKARAPQGITSALNYNISLEDTGYLEQPHTQQNLVQRNQMSMNQPYQSSVQFTALNSNNNSLRQQNDLRQRLYSGPPSQGSVLHQNSGLHQSRSTALPNRTNQRRGFPSDGQISPQPRNIRGSVTPNEAQQEISSIRSNSISSNGSRVTNTRSNVISHVSPSSVQTISIEQSSSNKIKDDINLYHQTGILNRNIIPPQSWVHPPNMLGINRPELNALHQALLRSPFLVPANLSSPTKNNDSSFKYYQAVRGFALAPSILSHGFISKFEFPVSEAEIIKIPLDSISCNGSIPSREFQQGTLQYRLRCIETSISEIEIPENEWMIKDTTWPENICLDINSRHLEIRRKVHHGKDLPIDITQHVLKNGIDSPNKVTVSIISGSNKSNDHNYFLAVEVIEILEHSQILQMCQKINKLPASHTLEMIKKSLAPRMVDNDDDFEMVISHISINLADPFTTCIFEIPARGKYCLHRECFDLETFLHTRISKPNRANQPCMVDVWKCPLCGSDARPWELQIDGYLESIRTELVEQGKLDIVRSIRVEPNGIWHPKVEKRKSFTDSLERKQLAENIDTLQQKAKHKKPIEVIVLEDD
ncbi:hypothetical protein OnM2_028028 [Erysiphe neolycopersici]|uniref:SP-RING-type domain-containing protein n=1 Tax=Erysiphe neolycopersici TaxID=212602 RepID=A0A420I041_9PEZI|nr:hypothetical protein OnM2_028028 [Erysiphe neolycopersici]